MASLLDFNFEKKKFYPQETAHGKWYDFVHGVPLAVVC